MFPAVHDNVTPFFSLNLDGVFLVLCGALSIVESVCGKVKSKIHEQAVLQVLIGREQKVKTRTVDLRTTQFSDLLLFELIKIITMFK